jgi:hypothetical protein
LYACTFACMFMCMYMHVYIFCTNYQWYFDCFEWTTTLCHQCNGPGAIGCACFFPGLYYSHRPVVLYVCFSPQLAPAQSGNRDMSCTTPQHTTQTSA